MLCIVRGGFLSDESCGDGMSGVLNKLVQADEGGMRLDRWFKKHFPSLPHIKLQKLLRSGQVRVDGKRAEASSRLVEGQGVRVPPLPDEAAEPLRKSTQTTYVPKGMIKDLEDRILYIDDDILVINKPYGLAVQGGTGTNVHLDAALEELKFGMPEKPRLVHRLDKDTAGVLVLARHVQAARNLAENFKNHHARKYYWAVVQGVPNPLKGNIEAALAKSGESYERMAVDELEGKHAFTYYSTLQKPKTGEVALVALWPVTGRTHQLRAHCALIGNPIVGDGKYGQKDNLGLSRQLHLFARRLILPHPIANTMVDVEAPLPDHFKPTFERFGFDAGDVPEDPFRKIRV